MWRLKPCAITPSQDSYSNVLKPAGHGHRFACSLIRDLTPTHSSFTSFSLLSYIPDINSDGVLDEQELEALFTKEVSYWKLSGLGWTYFSLMHPKRSCGSVALQDKTTTSSSSWGQSFQ